MKYQIGLLPLLLFLSCGRDGLGPKVGFVEVKVSQKHYHKDLLIIENKRFNVLSVQDLFIKIDSNTIMDIQSWAARKGYRSGGWVVSPGSIVFKDPHRFFLGETIVVKIIG
ncbi:MAG: hypothetical protein OXH50_12965 [Gemmatimonadetes bacterium]|nr:hypothetical protein [Gemmatimonadota bacterium]